MLIWIECILNCKIQDETNFTLKGSEIKKRVYTNQCLSMYEIFKFSTSPDKNSKISQLMGHFLSLDKN